MHRVTSGRDTVSKPSAHKPHKHHGSSSRTEEDRAERERAKVERDARPEHRLHRETPFICNIRFRNNLPDVPADPRLLVSGAGSDQLSAFCLTDLERNPKWDIHFEPDAGIPVSLLDSQHFAVPAGAPKALDPKDEALLQDQRDGPDPGRGTRMTGPSAFLKAKVSDSSLDKGLPWLMCTTYISNDSLTTPSRRKEKPDQTRGGSPSVTAPQTIDDQIKLIEESFRKAQQDVPRHPRNPSLRPVEVLPVLPDFRYWMNNYLLVNFDNDPTEDHPRLSRLHPNQRKVLSERAVFKTFSTGEQNFFGYMVPKDLPKVEDDGCRDVYVDELEGEYQWIREYHREKKESEDDKRTFLLRVGEDQVSYVDLNTNIVVKKRGSKTVKGSETSAGTELLPSLRPRSVSLKRRELAPAEEEQRRTKMATLMGTDA